MIRVLAIGDIHGCFRSLATLVDLVAIGDDDVLVTLGDYVDRGPQSHDVLECLIAFDERSTLVPLRGDHEIMMLSARSNPAERRRWALSGAGDTLDSYTLPDGGVAQIEDVPERH